MSRESLHNLVNRIPEAELPAAQSYLELLVSEASRANTQSVIPDDDWRAAGRERFTAAYAPEDEVYERLIDDPAAR